MEKDMKFLPRFLRDVIDKYPDIWKHYQALGAAVGEMEGLDKKTQQLVKLGISIGAGSEGAVHSHTRRAINAGCTEEEVYHAALLSVTTLGWPQAVAALSWVDDVLNEIKT